MLAAENPEIRNLPSFLFGQSMGGAVALKVHMKQPDAWNGAVLLAPMCKVSFWRLFSILIDVIVLIRSIVLSDEWYCCTDCRWHGTTMVSYTNSSGHSKISSKAKASSAAGSSRVSIQRCEEERAGMWSFYSVTALRHMSILGREEYMILEVSSTRVV